MTNSTALRGLRAPAALLAILESPEVTDLLINGPESVWVDGPSGLKRLALHLGDARALRALATQLAAQGGQRLDDAAPAADVRLPGGVRLHAVLEPIAVNGPLLSFRIARGNFDSLEALVAAGTVAPQMATVISNMLEARLNFLISGGTGTGKTTLLGALLGLVPANQRIVVIEEAAELNVAHPNIARVEARGANAEGKGAFTLADLVRQALRMRPDRIVVGEVRGGEVRELFTALNTGHSGSCGTIHANSTADVPSRLAALGALAGMSPAAVAAQGAAGLDAVIHMVRDRVGNRVVSQVAALTRDSDELVAIPALNVENGQVKQMEGWEVLSSTCGRTK